MTRTYDLYSIRHNSEVKLNRIPMTHNEVCTFKSRFTPYEGTIYQIKEIAAVPYVDICEETAYGTKTRLSQQIRVF